MSEEFKTSKARAERCVTHHHACDCREYKFQELEAEVKRWQQQSNKHYLYSCELDKTVAYLNAELAELREGVKYYKEVIRLQEEYRNKLLQESSDE